MFFFPLGGYLKQKYPLCNVVWFLGSGETCSIVMSHGGGGDSVENHLSLMESYFGRTEKKNLQQIHRRRELTYVYIICFPGLTKHEISLLGRCPWVLRNEVMVHLLT